MRIGDLVEHEHDAGGRQILDAGRRQGIALGQETLVHGVGRKPCGDDVGPDQFKIDRRRDAVIGQTARGVLGRQEPADAARGIGECGGDGVPAIEDDRSVGIAAPGARMLAAARAIAAPLRVRLRAP